MRIRQFMNPSCSLILIILWLAACSATPTRVSPTTALTSALTPIPTLSLTDTAASVKEFAMSDFDAVHSQIAGDLIPNVVGELRFRVTDGAKPALEWQIVWPIKSVEIDLHL